MSEVAAIKTGSRGLKRYNPEKGLKTIAVSEAAEKHFARAKDATGLCKAIDRKIRAQADYVVWRDGVVVPSRKKGGSGSNQHGKRARVSEPKPVLPAADPGDVVAHRWRKKLTIKLDGTTVIHDQKLLGAIDDAQHRAVRICEQEKDGTVRGTEGTGEFERYTPQQYIEAARAVLGQIDLDPATSKLAQQTVRATNFFTADDNGLIHEWLGRIWLNPPYHRELAPQFINKLVDEFKAGRVSAAIVLTNNCTDTDWFDAALKACAAICFTHGRIRFTTEKGSEVLPTQGQAFFYYGSDVDRFEDVFCVIGSCMRPSRTYEPRIVSTESCVMDVGKNGEG